MKARNCEKCAHMVPYTEGGTWKASCEVWDCKFEERTKKKTGRWITEVFPIACSRCGRAPIIKENGAPALTHYCPSCGAEMTGGAT